jgi:two-component system cell cycle sensor histidine kinase PleC
VRTVREQLASTPDLRSRIDHDLLTMFITNELAAQGTILLVAAIFAFASLFWAPWTQAVLWLAAVVAAKILLLEGCRRFLADPSARQQTERWTRRFMALEALNAGAWSGLVLVGMGNTSSVLGDHQTLAEPIFLFASLVVVLSVRMALAAPVLAIFYWGTIPLTVVVAARIGVGGEPFHLSLALMAVAVQLYFMFLAGGINQTARAMIAYRAEKDVLIAEIEAQRSVAEAARRRAEDANVAKSSFLATMSHELRTPLNAILGFTEVMKNELMGPLQNETYKDYCGNIHDSGSHLLKLINEILDLSRIEAGRYELHEEEVQLIDIVDDCHRLLRLKAEAKGLEIVGDYDEALPPLRADERALRQICLNLVSNALKFTPRGGSITLVVEGGADGGQRLRVRDTGPGIPANEIPRVLEAFGQGSLAQRTAEGGSGLGLPIVRSLAELHGGRFELKSELRRGTEAVVEFPAARVAARAATSPASPSSRAA